MEIEGRRRRHDDSANEATEGTNDRAGFIALPNRGRLSTYIAQVGTSVI